jgi:hypothetical protein
LHRCGRLVFGAVSNVFLIQSLHGRERHLASLVACIVKQPPNALAPILAQ